MFKLFWKRSFTGMITCQTLGALNDNVLRQAYLLLAIQLAGAEQQAAAVAFTAIPFIFFSPLAGQITDRYSKRDVIVWMKFVEVVVMSFAAWAAWHENLFGLLMGIFLMFGQSAFFSPSKYGILPEILAYEEMSEGNGILQSSTYLAILFGGVIAGGLLELAPMYWLALFFVIVSLLGWLSSLIIEPLPAADPELEINYNPFARMVESITWIRKDPFLFYLMLGYAYGWGAGAILTLAINVYGLEVLGLGELLTSGLLVALAMGIGLGSLLAGLWSGKKIELGLIPLGAVGLTVTMFFLSLVSESVMAAYGWLFLGGIFSALFLIPFQAALQERPPKEKKGDLLASTNVFSFTGVVVASAVYVLLIELGGYGSRTLLFLVGIVTLAATVALFFFLPWLLVRFALWTIAHLFFNVDVEGRKQIPISGATLFRCGTKKLSTPLLINYVIPRPAYVLLPRNLYENAASRWLFKLIGVIPYDPDSSGNEAVIDQVAEEFEGDRAVCLVGDEEALALERNLEELAESKLHEVDVEIEIDRGDTVFSRLRTPAQVRFSNGVDEEERR